MKLLTFYEEFSRGKAGGERVKKKEERRKNIEKERQKFYRSEIDDDRRKNALTEVK